MKFYLGLDIGTDSVGAACTDGNYNLLRAKGKDLWTVRLFDEAQDASERRAKRTARRRLEREKQRIDMLQEIFAPYIEDELFFIRLNNSGFYEEDKDARLDSANSLFANDSYRDKDFYREYPTIFHLRRELAHGDNRHDLRLYYLAIHHIIKYRGHFLAEGESMNDVRDIKKLFYSFNNASRELFGDEEIKLDVEKADAFYETALNSDLRLKDKKKAVETLLAGNSKQLKAIVDFMIGASIKPSLIFGDDCDENVKNEKSFSLKGLNDEAFDAKAENFSEEEFEFLHSIRAIYNFLVFEKILKGNRFISEAMVGIYEKHKADLALLKKFVKAEYPQKYYCIFRSVKEKANYANYIGYTKSKGTRRSAEKCNLDEFYKFLKKILSPDENIKDRATYEYILSEIESGAFLPKILNSDNGLFPHQINCDELDAIIDNLLKEYPAFGEKDDSGLSAADKIRKIFLYKIPYFVGPLNTYHEDNGNSWAVRKSGIITPWNFDDMVDKAASNEKFIRRMTKKCSYLYGKDVLPKCSLYYQAYDVLNQLNKLKFSGQPISVDLKKELFNKLFLKERKVTLKRIRDYLAATGRLSAAEAKDLIIKGTDEEWKANMSSYRVLKDILGDYADANPEICENIILWHTLNTDKRIVEELILRNYGNEAAVKENIKALRNISSFKDFGRLSKELLFGISGGVNPETGEIYTVLGELYNTNLNFNELIYSDKYRFLQSIEEENSGRGAEIDYDAVKELYVAPMVRRGIWQALKITDEYVNAVGHAPDKIFIEVTRQDEEKTRKESRKNKLLNYFETIKEDCNEIDELAKELNASDMTDAKLRSERLYLYFLQLGRCAYSGKQIDLAQLATDLYDVDHILPRSVTKDDSLDNKVLVLRELNLKKSDKYPLSELPSEYVSQRSRWKLLKDKGLMSEKKYALLTRTKPLGEDDFNEFINRQLVITNQTVKAVAELLKQKYEASGTKIVYSKAKNVNDFRQQFHLTKCRETNDLHHARDAYLNIVVGNVYDTKFTCAKDYFYRKGDVWKEYNLQKLFENDVNDAWVKDTSILNVKKTLEKPSMTVTRYSYVNHGGFYNETIYGKQDTGVSVPRKDRAPYNIKNEDGTFKYGGYKSLTTAYFSIVKSSDKKGGVIKTIEAVPVLVDYRLNGNKEKLKAYFEYIGLKNVEILVPKVKMKSLISVNGFRAWIAGVTGNQIIVHNATEWFTDSKTDEYIKNLVKLEKWKREGKLSETEKTSEEILMHTNRFGDKTLTIDRVGNLKLYREIIEKLNDKKYQCISGVRSYRNKLIDKENLFADLTVIEQCLTLLQIVRFMKCNAECSDLTNLCEGKECGKLLINKNISDVDFTIIHQSPCGLTTRIQKV